MTFRPATEPRPVPFPRWLVLTPAEPHEKLAVLTGKLKQRQAKNMAATIATATGTPVVVVEERRGVRNPTLVHHGLAKGAAFHVTSTLSGPIADVYGSSPMVARAVAQLVSNAIGEQVEVTRNTLVGKGSVHSRVDSRLPRARFERPSRNPAEPKPGEVWATLNGAKARVITVTNARVHVLHLDSGNREWLGRSEFFAAYREPRVRPRPNPTRRDLEAAALAAEAKLAEIARHRRPTKAETAEARAAYAAAAEARRWDPSPNPKGRAKGRKPSRPVVYDGTVTLTDHHVAEFARAAQAMYARGENALGHLLSAVSAKRTVPAEQYDRAAEAYRAWLVFDEPKAKKNPNLRIRHIYYVESRGGTHFVMRGTESGRGKRVIMGTYPTMQAATDEWVRLSQLERERAIKAAGRRPNPKGRKRSRGNPDSWMGWKTGDRFVLKHDIGLHEGEFKAGTPGRLTLVSGPPIGTAFAVFDTTPNLYPVPVSVKWLARPGRAPKPNPRGRKPSRGSEMARARRTAEMWNEFPATTATRLKVRSRTIPSTLVKLGDVHSVVYRSNKYDGKNKLHEHRFKRPLPVLASDPDGRVAHFVGGDYKITGDGLVD